LYGTWHTRALLSGDDTRDLAREWVEKNLPPGSLIVHSTLGAGTLGMAHPGGIYTRQNNFSKSYSGKELMSAYEWLAQRDDLPPIYISINAGIGLEQIAGDLDKPYSLGAIVESEHPLSLREGEEALQQLESIAQWQAEFGMGGAQEANFDLVDWYFLPIGGYADTERTGPDIKLGLLPMATTRQPMSTREFFSMLYLFLDANKKMKEKDEAGALAIYERIWAVPFSLDTALTSDFMFDLLSNMGLAYQREGNLERSAYFWSKAIELSPDKANSYNNLGVVYARGGDSERALSMWEEAIKREPGKANTHFNMGNVLYGLGQYTEAVDAWQRAMELDTIYESAYYNMGNAHFKMGNLDAALKAYEAAQRREPQRADIYFNRGQIYIRMQQVEPAIEAFEHSVELAPNDADSYYHLGDLYRSSGALEKARLNLLRFVELAPQDRRVGSVLQLLESIP